MPAATWDAPDPGSASQTVTVRPRCAARHAIARPMTPPPTTTTSGLTSGTGVLPFPALPGRFDGRRRFGLPPSLPLSPVLRAPVFARQPSSDLGRTRLAG